MKIDLEGRLPQKIFRIIKIASKIADKEKFSVYIVGGTVRDILLNLPNYDVDFVVEGDGVRFAEILNRQILANLKIYKPFKTATLIFSGGKERIDIVTARQESYKKPAAYPDVQLGTIKDDLFRRDFTINAMAISLRGEDLGEVVDFYNGSMDLRKGIIRVMHNRSFIDDPTRIFRAVRFSVRFNFKIEPHTKNLLKEALSSGVLAKVNRGRIRKEVELFLKERDPLKCLKMFEGLV